MNTRQRTTSSDSRQSLSERVESTAPSTRLRTACDACHHAKVKCSGNDPCSSCQASQVRCVYSPASRQGRPKGSKNKRTLMQERNVAIMEMQTTQERSHVYESKGPWRPRQQSEHKKKKSGVATTLNLDLGHDTGSMSDANHCLSDTDLLPGAHIDSSYLGPVSTDSYFDQGFNAAFGGHPNDRALASALEDPSSFSIQTSSDLAPASYSASSGTLDSSYKDSTDGTSVPSPFPRDLNMFSPGGSPFSGYVSRLSSSVASSITDQCSCLQQLVQLVYRLDDLKQSYDKCATIDTVLQGVQMAHGPWENLTHCERCSSHTGQDEVFLLLAMSIRTLLRLFQVADLSGVGVSVGSYELSGKFRATVVDQLAREALQSIMSALRHLQQHAGRRRYLLSGEHGGDQGGWNAANGMLFGTSVDTQTQNAGLPFDLDANSVGFLLETLHGTMQSMKQDLRGSL